MFTQLCDNTETNPGGYFGMRQCAFLHAATCLLARGNVPSCTMCASGSQPSGGISSSFRFTTDLLNNSNSGTAILHADLARLTVLGETLYKLPNSRTDRLLPPV